ncbi:CBS domain-containing protein [Streptomyces sp. S.PB5]|uniref:CBS domain-containing protein n=1 Tax=Streptomyces sp. S.PB5 TaxID=3020844 RepID=UPI0025B01CDC|nr:CBS domain-containing protein [Streptomyces sp. S.PB5]MDN3027939.1 CBS domain-containing protein [Streptomyces sp. S.PB5]
MRHRTVADLMTRDVVRARCETPFKELVRLLADHDVTAVPVVDDLDRPLGVVSETDLLRKCSVQTDSVSRTPLPHPQEWERAKAQGVKAEELMSAPAVCVHPEWTVAEAARLMMLRSVKRLPVVDEAGRLKGIVSRGDLLRVFLRRDDAIRDEIAREVLQETLRLAPSDVTVEVSEGRVTLHGSVTVNGLIPIIERLCRSVDGVVSVRAHIGYRVDESLAQHGPGATPPAGARPPERTR